MAYITCLSRDGYLENPGKILDVFPGKTLKNKISKIQHLFIHTCVHSHKDNIITRVFKKMFYGIAGVISAGDLIQHFLLFHS